MGVTLAAGFQGTLDRGAVPGARRSGHAAVSDVWTALPDRAVSRPAGRGKYRSRACVPSPATRAEVWAKISAAARQQGRGAGAGLRALDPARVASVPAPERDMLCLYSGLDPQRPHTLREIGTQ